MPDTLIPDLQVYSSALEVVKSGHPLFPTLPQSTADMPIITVVASSTEQDLQGDTMAMSALQDMCNVPIGQSVFRSHSYELPDNYFGKSVVTPTIVQNSGVADLHTAYAVYIKDEANRKTYDQIESFGARHGVSGGFMITQYSYMGDSDEWFAPILIEHLLKVEDSIVGIPASQRSWVEHAIEGLFERCIREDNGEEALRLAPAFKGLFHNKYRELAKSLRSDGLRKDLEARPIRALKGYDKTKLFWEPLKKHFVFQQGSRSRIVEREEIPDILKSVQGTSLDTTKSASGKTSWPLMSLDTEWTGSKATKEIFAYAKNDDGDIVATKAKQCHLHYDPDKADVQAGYSFPFVYVDGDSPKIVPLGVRACAGILNGSMGGTKADDQEAMKAKVKTMYGKINSELKPDPKWVVPWEKDDKAMTISVTKEEVPEASDSPIEPVVETEPIIEPVVEEEAPVDPVVAPESVPDVVIDLDPVKQYQLEMFNTLGKALWDNNWLPKGITGMFYDITGQSASTLLDPERVKSFLTFANDLATKSASDGKMNGTKHVQAYAQVLHDIAKSMGGSEVCSTSDANSNEDDGDDEGQGATMSFEPLLNAMDAQTKAVGSLIDALTTKQSLETSIKAVADSVDLYSKEIAALNLKHKKAVADVNKLADSVQTLKNMPLGNPTMLDRTVTQQQGTVGIKDFLAINTDTETYEEALARTTVSVKTLNDGRTLSYRHWPVGVGKGLIGEVEGGVRPALTNAQKSKMSVASWGDYEQGLDAQVPELPGE